MPDDAVDRAGNTYPIHRATTSKAKAEHALPCPSLCLLAHRVRMLHTRLLAEAHVSRETAVGRSSSIWPQADERRSLLWVPDSDADHEVPGQGGTRQGGNPTIRHADPTDADISIAVPGCGGTCVRDGLTLRSEESRGELPQARGS
jgi:hypothetical protein